MKRFVFVFAVTLAIIFPLAGCEKADEEKGPGTHVSSSPGATGTVAVPAPGGPPSAAVPTEEETPAPASSPETPTPVPGKTLSAEPPGKPEGKNAVVIARFDSASMENGVPRGWELDRKCGTSSMNVEEAGSFCLRLTSDNESSFGVKRGAQVDIQEYPFLNWRWKVTRLPKGGDIRKSGKDDQAIQIYVAFPATGWPAKLNTPVVGYIWDNESPKGWTGRSAQIGGNMLRYVVVRNKTDRLGEWYSEKRNIYDDYRKLFKDVKEGRPAGPTRGVELYINSQHTGSSAESYICEVYFSKS